MKNYAVSFSTQPRVEAMQLDNGQRVFIVDDVLDHPERIVQLARDFGNDFVHAEGSPYPGRQLLMPDDFSARMDEFFRLHLRALLKSRRSLAMYSRLSRVTLPAGMLDARQRICHRDSAGVDPLHTISASVLYLFENPTLGGTVFFQPLGSETATESLVMDASSLSSAEFGQRYDWPASYMTRSNAHFRVIGRVPAKWNRVIFYDGRIFHSSDIEHPEKLDDPAGMGRLTVNAFFTCTRPAQ
jgi:hypothetical protein